MGYDPSEPRDRIGEWTTGGGGSNSLNGPHVLKTPMAKPGPEMTPSERVQVFGPAKPTDSAGRAYDEGRAPPQLSKVEAELYLRSMAGYELAQGAAGKFNATISKMGLQPIMPGQHAEFDATAGKPLTARAKAERARNKAETERLAATYATGADGIARYKATGQPVEQVAGGGGLVIQSGGKVIQYGTDLCGGKPGTTDTKTAVAQTQNPPGSHVIVQAPPLSPSLGGARGESGIRKAGRG